MSDNQNNDAAANGSLPNDFLPDLCTTQSIFLLVLVAELLALLMALNSAAKAQYSLAKSRSLTSVGLQYLNWDILALISFQVQWIALVSAALLCKLRPYLRRWSPVRAGAISYASVLLVALVLSVLGQWVLGMFEGRAGQGRWLNIDGWLLATNLCAAAILAGIVLRYLYLQQQLRNQQQAELQARIQALQSRIRPHFLFNSMNSIASLIATEPETAERVVEDLSELFRASLAEPTLIPLKRELTLCRHYLEIEKLRLGDRLQVEWQIDNLPEELQIPGLLLQPLLENAVFHGIEPLPKGGRILIEVRIKEKQVVIRIANPVVLAAHHATGTGRQSNRMARQNIRHRLTAHYGPDARLSTMIDSGTFTTLITYPKNP